MRDCPDGFVIARTVEEVKYYIENFNVEILSLDHDLVKYICKKGLRAEKIYLHTDNSVFCLDNIDWDECNRVANKSIMYEVCCDYEKYKDLKFICSKKGDRAGNINL